MNPDRWEAGPYTITIDKLEISLSDGATLLNHINDGINLEKIDWPHDFKLKRISDKHNPAFRHTIEFSYAGVTILELFCGHLNKLQYAIQNPSLIIVMNHVFIRIIFTNY